MKTKHQFTDNFKAKVGLEAFREISSLNEIASNYELLRYPSKILDLKQAYVFIYLVIDIFEVNR